MASNRTSAWPCSVDESRMLPAGTQMDDSVFLPLPPFGFFSGAFFGGALAVVFAAVAVFWYQSSFLWSASQSLSSVPSHWL